MTLLEARGLGKSFSVRTPGGRRTLVAVEDASFTVAEGETLALVGESGSGKSTLARLALGLLPATSGTVRFDGYDLARLPAAALRRLRKQMQLVFQDPQASLDPRMTVLATLLEPLEIHRLGSSRRDRAARAAALLGAVGLGDELLGRAPHELSGGQRQRVGIARALATEPRLIVLDEPLSALDVSIQAQLLELLAALQRDRGLAYLFVTHDLRLVGSFARRVAVMYAGRLVEELPAAALEQATHPYTRALVSVVPRRPSGSPRPRGEPLPGEPPSSVDRPAGCAFHPRCPLRASHPDPRCQTEVPDLRELPGGHRVACHLA